ncbi:hypothetical protein GCM10009844_22710 [Nocardioides koreensis]|uniref:Uncharacterized protein n=1 Tax=Nocardioides koreensis TaxID=433651 RepID=A0ABP5LFX4_9ACTN
MPRVKLTPAPDPEKAARHLAWTQAAAERAREARKVRGDQLALRENAIRVGQSMLETELERLRPESAILRTGLLYLPTEESEEDVNPDLSTRRPSESPGLLSVTVKSRVADRPPLGQLVHRGGAAIPLLLAAIGVAAARGLPRDAVDLSDIPNTGTKSWAKLIGDGDPSELARRHVVDAVKRLRQHELVRLRGPITKNPGYSAWQLRSEDGSDGPYRVPAAGLSVPMSFWKNGWAQVLTPPEIVAYLMIRHLAANFPTAHEDRGVGATPARRRQRYGVTKRVYATLNELEEFGLVHRTTPQRPEAEPDDSVREVSRFQVAEDGLDQDAYTRVKKTLDDWPVPLRAYRYDPLEAMVRSIARQV